MNHRKARHHLVDLADGALSDERRGEVEAHVENCERCQGWLATYRVIEASTETSSPHPASDVLASYAVEPADLSEHAQAEVRTHMASCMTCATEYRLTREALVASRPDGVDWVPGRVPAGRERSMQPWAAAALLAATLLLALVLVGPEKAQVASLSDSVITGREVVQSEDRLLASNIQLAESSDLRLRAPQGVVLREGFSVGKGARLSIDTGEGVDATH